ncbi:MAG: FKBP-type peptidyl-prolyl cis-trans isomerase [Bacteroidaceae bacterium]|nr:FKBP-type peptidyl-prolyl cis-trans isomerase [Bacteroidaceae bacterium]
MKKLIFAAAAIAAIMFTSCDNTSVKADLKDNVDSLTNFLGIAQSDGLKNYMKMQLQVDSMYTNDFIKGMIEGATAKEDPQQEAYMKGLTVGKQVKDMAENLSSEVYADDSTKKVPVKNLLAGIIAGLKGEATMTPDSAYGEFEKRLKPLQTAALERKYATEKAANEKFLADNAKKEGVTVLPSGVQYKVLKEGTGALPTDTSTVKCLYEGRLIDGTVFDSNTEEGREPFEVNLGMPRVIPGWVEALKQMPAGSKWEVYIPQELAYGQQDMGQIKPFSTLIFTIEVLK